MPALPTRPISPATSADRLHPSAAVAPVIALRPTVPVASVQGALALDLTPQLDPPETGPALVEPSRPGDLVAADPRQRAELDRFVRRYLSCAVEIASGDRPIAQLLRHTAPSVYHDLARRAQLVTAAAGTSPSQGRGRGAVRPSMRTAHTSLVQADSLEVAAHVRYGERSRAVAARFAIHDGRWQCVALEFG